MEGVISNLRDRELSLIRKAAALRTFSDMLNSASPFLVSSTVAGGGGGTVASRVQYARLAAGGYGYEGVWEGGGYGRKGLTASHRVVRRAR